MRDIQSGQRIGALQDQERTWLKRPQRLAGPQDGQRTLQAAEIERQTGHVVLIDPILRRSSRPEQDRFRTGLDFNAKAVLSDRMRKQDLPRVRTRGRRASGVVSTVLVSAALASGAIAQTTAGPHDSSQTPGDVPEAGHGILHLSAALANESTLLKAGAYWRIVGDHAGQDGTHKVVAESRDAQPTFDLPNGTYVAHLTYGFASQMKRITLAGQAISERMMLNAGALEVKGLLGETPIAPDKLSLSVYVPDRGNPQAKLVIANAKPGQILRLPEGLYHVVSTYLDTVGVGSLIPVSSTNSVINADVRVQAGKLVTVSVRHKAAVLTLKLVNALGGEALANSSFTILTPGGDVIRELIGAYPSLVLAEGDYIAIARHDGKTFQTDFKVDTNTDRDIEIPTK